MGAPVGNTNSRKENRLWGDTIRRVAAQNPDKLRKIAEKLLEKAEEGDISAMKELGDRVDGKSVQQTDVNLEGHVAIERIERVITDPSNRNAESIPTSSKP